MNSSNPLSRLLALLIKRKKLSVLAAAALIIIYYAWHRHTTAASMPAMGAMPVSVLELKTQHWPTQIETIGTVNAKQGIILKASIAGPVTQIAFKSHSTVEKDQVLIEIYPNELRELLAESKAKLSEAEADFKRIETLFHSGNATASELDKRRTALDVLKATIAANEAKYQLAVIHAPFKGRLGLRKVSLGDYLRPGDEIVGLYDLEHLRVDFQIPQQYASALHLGDAVSLTTSAQPNKIFQATVESFDSYVDPNSRTLMVRAAIQNPGELLLPGMFVNVTLTLKTDHPTLAIPQTALTYSLYGDTVFKVIDGQAISIPVTTGMRNGTLVEVLSGLSAGDHIVLTGQEKLRDHTKVSVVSTLSDPALINPEKPSYPQEK